MSTYDPEQPVPKRILSIDGGGIRGLIPAMLLAEIEKRTERRIADLFDLIAGTSTGGIIALGLVKPDENDEPEFTAADLVELYETEGPNIFSRSRSHRLLARLGDFFRNPVELENMFEEKYVSAGLEQVLKERFGETTIGDAVTEVLITSYGIETRKPWFFTKWKASGENARPGYDLEMWRVARATSAAPTYFEPLEWNEPAATNSEPPWDRPEHDALIDGGVFANNPAMCAWAEATKLWGEKHQPPQGYIVSLGTGEQNRAIPYAKAKGWGVANWAPRIVDVVFDGVSDTVDHQLATICPPERYHRFQIELDFANDDMDNITSKNIADLKEEARRLLKGRHRDFDGMCGQLASMPPVRH